MCKRKGFAVRLVSYAPSDEYRLLVRLQVVDVRQKVVVDQVSTIRGILDHLKGTGGGKRTAVPLLLAYVGFRANAEQRSNMSRTALSQALNAETATAAASDCNKGEEQIDAVTSTSSSTSLTHAHQPETATRKRGVAQSNKLKLKRPKF